jgi:hypothetical protein
MKSFGWVLLLAIFILIIIFVFGHFANQDNTRSTVTESGDVAGVVDVVVESPEAEAVVTSPLEVRGEAKGNWFFEGSLPVKLEDGNGEVLALAPAQAEGDWMTESMVGFHTTLTFSESTTTDGVLVVAKDNPSGLPEYDQEIRIPVRFQK